jgi:hypothetical protein
VNHEGKRGRPGKRTPDLSHFQSLFSETSSM